MYVINSPAMVNAVQRHQKVLSFTPFMASSTVRMFGFEGAGAARLVEDPEDGKGFLKKINDAAYASLLGDGLDRMNENMAKRLKPFVDALAMHARASEPLDLYAWCRHTITLASTSGVFGPQNPFESPEIEQAFWTFERSLVPLNINFLPRLTARKGLRARETLVRAFETYYENAGHVDSSEFIYARWKCQNDAGTPLHDIARLEAGIPLGLMTNTVPMTFWMLFDIYSRPLLLEEIRKEVMEHAVGVESGRKYVVDLGKIRDKCPLLVSSFQESLRLRTIASPIRTGKKDVLLCGTYKIKAGSIIQMPGPVFSRCEEAWGEGAAAFDPWRFVKSDSTGTGDGQTNSAKRASSFLAFGTVPNMCPGRHFASGEILAVTAMVLLRFDVMPKEREWKEPRMRSMALSATVNCPADGFAVRMKVREEYESIDWDFRVTPGKGRFGLITG